MNIVAQSIPQVLASLQTTMEGLSSFEAEKRLKANGPNVLPKSHVRAGALRIFFRQWRSVLILLLLAAGIISLLLQEIADAVIIFVTIFINVLLGFFQEYKAERALSALESLVTYQAVVLRDGVRQQIGSDTIVPGDIMLIEAGDSIQADGRIIQSNGLLVNESVLTGESLPAKKESRALSEEPILADRVNMVYRGTIVLDGSGMVAVSAIGTQTEVGNIASLMQRTREPETPLQQQLSRLGKWIGIMVFFVCAALFAFGVVAENGAYTIFELFKTAVAVSVAAIPEGLPITITVLLAVGMQKLLKRGALARSLLAAETLGSVSVICTDKTGTLTEGKMRVTALATKDGVLQDEQLSDLLRHTDAFHALHIGVLCNDGTIVNAGEKEAAWKFLGDTTDGALLYAGMKWGAAKHVVEEAYPRVSVLPFSSVRKYMATLHEREGKNVLYVKGSPETLLAKSVSFEKDGSPHRLTDDVREEFRGMHGSLVDKGLRVLGVAYRRFPHAKTTLAADDVADLIFVGFIALRDPIRPDVPKMIEHVRAAGIRVIIITGDHVRTARFIAESLGLPSGEKDAMDGTMLDALSSDELKEMVKSVSLFARVEPRHKIRIVKALHESHLSVAMTGDGVNDAPALKAADIGIAVGSGTDVAKETADIVLLDNSFATIVAAVEEGRTIYQNIRKVLLYLFSGSLKEVLLVGSALVFALPLPVLPAQILWMNIVEESFAVVALAFDRGEKDSMRSGPASRGSLFDWEMKILIVALSVIPNIVLFWLYRVYLDATNDLLLTRTVMFAGLGIGALLSIYSIRNLRQHIWETSLFDNPAITVSVLIGWALLLGAVYAPPLQWMLSTVPLGWKDWITLLAFGFGTMMLIEAVKGIYIRRKAT